jgi:hypothetical protein
MILITSEIVKITFQRLARISLVSIIAFVVSGTIVVGIAMALPI